LNDGFLPFRELSCVCVLYANTNEIAGSMSATFNTLMKKAPKV